MCPLSIGTLNSFMFIPTIMHRVQCMALASALKDMQFAHCMQNENILLTKVLYEITIDSLFLSLFLKKKKHEDDIMCSSAVKTDIRGDHC